jgi:hypothetical protein
MLRTPSSSAQGQSMTTAATAATPMRTVKESFKLNFEYICLQKPIPPLLPADEDTGPGETVIAHASGAGSNQYGSFDIQGDLLVRSCVVSEGIFGQPDVLQKDLKLRLQKLYHRSVRVSTDVSTII